MRSVLILFTAVSMLAAPPTARKERIHVPLWVQNQNGGAPDSLKPGDLAVRVSGANSPAAGLLGPGDDLMLLVVSDMVGDITQAQTAKQALNERIAKLPANAAVGLLRAQDGLRTLVDPTAERAPLQAAIDALPISGRAGLLETVQAVTTLGDAILAKASVRLAVLYITDSDVSNYREDFTNPTVNWSDSGDISRRFRDGLVREKISKVDAMLSGGETPIFILHLVYRTDTLNQAYQTGLMTLASTTGGRTYFCRSQAEVPDAVGKVFADIVSHYSLAVPLPKSRPKVIEIMLESPGRALNWRTRFSLN